VAPTVHLLPDKVARRHRRSLDAPAHAAWPQAGHSHFDRSPRELHGAGLFLAPQPQCQIDPVDLTEPAIVDRPAAPRDEIVLELLQLPG
jgi:hypothetical protein